MTFKQVAGFPYLCEMPDRDRGVDIVERLDRDVGFDHFVERGHAVRKIRAHHSQVGRAQLGANNGKHLSPGSEDSNVTIRRSTPIPPSFLPPPPPPPTNHTPH